MSGEPRFEELLSSLNHVDLAMRLTAIVLLGERRDQRAVKPLLLAYSQRPDVERAAIMDSFRLLDDLAFTPLSTILLRDLNPILRGDAAYILGELNNPAAIAPLSQAARESNDMVRALAVAALAKFHTDGVLASLLDALHDSHLSVSLEAALALGRRGDVRAVDKLIEAAEKQWLHPQNIPMLLQALASTQDPRVVEILADALDNEDPAIQIAAIDALGTIDEIRSIEVLQSMLQDEMPLIRQTAAQALRRLGYRTDF